MNFDELAEVLDKPLPSQELTSPLWEFPEVIDSSILATWRLCNEKAKYAFFNKLAPPSHNPHLLGGGAFAHSLFVAREVYSNLGNQAQAEQAGFDALLHFYQGKTGPAHPHKNINGVCDGYVAYFKKWPLSSDPFQIEYSEADFAIPTKINHPLTGKPILYVGRIDMLAKAAVGGARWTVDEKTAGSFNEFLSFKFRFRPQFLGYNYALRRSFGIPVVGTLVRMIIINGSRLDPFELPIVPTEEDLEIWWRQTQIEISRFRGDFISKFSPRNGDACTHWRRPCEFFDLCNAPKAKLSEQAKLFARNEWTPLRGEAAEEGEE